eukprot:360676_1
MACPSNAVIIQCSKCMEIQNSFTEYDIKCNGCSNKLTYPITAKIIQCPLCSTFMDVSHPKLPTMELIQHHSKKRKTNNHSNTHYYDSSDSNTT